MTSKAYKIVYGFSLTLDFHTIVGVESPAELQSSEDLVCFLFEIMSLSFFSSSGVIFRGRS